MSKARKRRAVLENAGMYRMNRQMRIEDFVFPYGQLDKNNEWVKLADLLPWDEAEEIYEFFDIAVVNDYPRWSAKRPAVPTHRMVHGRGTHGGRGCPPESRNTAGCCICRSRPTAEKPGRMS